MSDDPKLTPLLRDMLDRIRRATDNSGGIMLLAIVAAGGSSKTLLQRLINAGWAQRCDVQLPRGPVDGVRITDAGRAKLTAGRRS